MMAGNLFSRIPPTLAEELVEPLVETPSFRLERIVSAGQAIPPGAWYDQDRDEWVVLLSGSARLQFDGEPAARTLRPGDYLLIPAHRRHRVEATDQSDKTAWLALHF